MSILRVIALGALGVVAWDTVAAIAARALSFPYVWASVGSWGLYLWIGYAAAAPPRGIGAAAGSAAAVALVDATIGWTISWQLGPGRPPEDLERVPALLSAVLIVVVTMAILGSLGGLARRFGRATVADPE
jgi:hypothetical protein